ncbi:hypothetical protein [Streptomyces sp. NPDC047130]|uniref:hypothetical protein n=1 Tax=Streptomyces sp. NPDC047130 TaxID=3155261 RepID=UPI003401E596
MAGAVTAGLTAAFGFWIAPVLASFFLVSALPAGLPLLLMREHAQACARACLVVGTAMLTWAVIGAVIGMFLFVPTALVLLIAAYVDAGNRPGGRFAVATPLAAAAVLVLIVLWPALH